MNPRLRVAAVIAICAVAASHTTAGQRFTKQESDRFQTKLEQIVEHGNSPPTARTAVPRNLQLSETEVNSYLRYHGRDQIPVGIVDPELRALGGGRVGGRAIVDLDAVRTQKPRGWLDPLGYLTGKMPLTATGTLVTQNGVGRFQLESAEISGVTVPKTVVQELLSYYSRTPENPAGINMDDPFELPSRIREIRVGKGEAVVVQ